MLCADRGQQREQRHDRSSKARVRFRSGRGHHDVDDDAYDEGPERAQTGPQCHEDADECERPQNHGPGQECNRERRRSGSVQESPYGVGTRTERFPPEALERDLRGLEWISGKDVQPSPVHLIEALAAPERVRHVASPPCRTCLREIVPSRRVATQLTTRRRDAVVGHLRLDRRRVVTVDSDRPRARDLP